jgi:hypothetical protein
MFEFIFLFSSYKIIAIYVYMYSVDKGHIYSLIKKNIVKQKFIHALKAKKKCLRQANQI